jgi:hypothetical protein
MKKKILGGIVLLAIAAVAAWNVSLTSHNNDLSGIFLANTEALAQESVITIPCFYNQGTSCEYYIYFDGRVTSVTSYDTAYDYYDWNGFWA